MNLTREKLQRLQSYLKQQNLDALVIPSGDPHISEYQPTHYQARQYFSGFTGSAGTLIVTPDHAGLWTDSRYFVQAEMELDGIELMKQSIPHAPEHVKWLADALSNQARVGIEGEVCALADVQHMQELFAAKQIELVDISGYLNELWPERPSLPLSDVFEHDIQFAGKNRQDKLAAIKAEYESSRSLLLTALDEIAWILNIRANDLPYIPAAISYLLIQPKETIWFVDDSRIPNSLVQTLSSEDIQIKPYVEVNQYLKNLPETEKVLVNPSGLNWALSNALGAKMQASRPFVLEAMAIKNPTEIEHIRATMAKDGAALVKAFRWLEETLSQRTVKETEFQQVIEQSRATMPNYVMESFEAIVGYKGNGAIVHYAPQEDSCAEIKPEGVLLVDSGGQYLDGTTDITRTFHLSEPTDEEKRNYTLVLKGNLALQMQCFPKGTAGMQLDTLARMNLWNEGLNFGHGTGHGVGFFARVHEPPQGFATSAVTSRGTTTFKPGMITTNEPGYYQEGAYGIRIENVMFCKEGADGFLEHEALTLFPIETHWADLSLLTQKEISWLNAYHAKVFEGISPLLNADEKQWLEEKCKPIQY